MLVWDANTYAMNMHMLNGYTLCKSVKGIAHIGCVIHTSLDLPHIMRVVPSFASCAHAKMYVDDIVPCLRHVQATTCIIDMAPL